jgi:hypothetical protein
MYFLHLVKFWRVKTLLNQADLAEGKYLSLIFFEKIQQMIERFKILFCKKFRQQIGVDMGIASPTRGWGFEVCVVNNWGGCQLQERAALPAASKPTINARRSGRLRNLFQAELWFGNRGRLAGLKNGVSNAPPCSMPAAVQKKKVQSLQG